MSHQAISTDSLQQAGRTFPPSPEVVQHALINSAQYDAMYARSVNDSEKFWMEQSATLDWFKKPTHARKHEWNTDKRVI